MERHQVILAYDGTNYQGFQRQVSAPTIQGEVEKALERLNWRGSSILVAGRTDSGVHASGQVVSFDMEWKHSMKDLRSALNANLPLDIVAKSVDRVHMGFHPRFDASSRRYCYRIICCEVRDPIRERYRWRVRQPLDIEKMEIAAKSLLGTHSFSAFGTSVNNEGSTVRTIFSANWNCNTDNEGNSELVFDISANAFLYHMVRRLVFVLVQIGLRREKPEYIQIHLDQPPEFVTQRIAPPHGLSLEEVTY